MRLLLIAALLMAQDTGTITGVVKDAGTGAPLADYVVGISRDVKTRTDSQGRYTLRGVPPGTHRIGAGSFKREHADAYKTVTVAAGQELTAIDFAPPSYGEITGRVLDENKEPVPGMMVLLVAREYSLGVLRHIIVQGARTDDRGVYRVQRVLTGRSFLVAVQRSPSMIPAVSDAPAEPKLRKKVFAPTYYPGSTFIDGAQPIILRGGERREDVDISLARMPSFCVEGVLETDGGPAALAFEIAPERPSCGLSGAGGAYFRHTHGTTGTDGRLRICNLPPGDYQITVRRRPDEESEARLFFATAAVSITDRDVRNFRCQTRRQIPVPLEIVWDGAPPEKPVASKLSVLLWPLARSFEKGDSPFPTALSIPGEFVFSGVFPDEYSIHLTGVPKDLYIKDITYAGSSVLRSPLRVGSAIGDAKLRIVLARDGAVINARVADKDGNPVPDSYVLIFPAEATTETEVAAALVIGETDQKGVHTTNPLAPGKYLVLASTTPVDMSPESIGKLYQARTRAQEITLAPNANVAVMLTPTNLQ